MNDDVTSQYRFLDPQSAGTQCLCLEPNSVPCTAEEVYQSRQLSFAYLQLVACPRQDTAGARFTKNTPGSADSTLYFSAANLSKIFCPLSNSKSKQQPPTAATYSTFGSAAELNDYCANGVQSQYEMFSSTPRMTVTPLFIALPSPHTRKSSVANFVFAQPRAGKMIN